MIDRQPQWISTWYQCDKNSLLFLQGRSDNSSLICFLFFFKTQYHKHLNSRYCSCFSIWHLLASFFVYFSLQSFPLVILKMQHSTIKSILAGREGGEEQGWASGVSATFKWSFNQWSFPGGGIKHLNLCTPFYSAGLLVLIFWLKAEGGKMQ